MNPTSNGDFMKNEDLILMLSMLVVIILMAMLSYYVYTRYLKKNRG